MDTNALIILLVSLFIIAIITIAAAVLVIASNRKLITTSNSNKQERETLKALAERIVDNSNTDKNNPGKTFMNTMVKLRTATKENCIAAMNEIDAARIAIYLFHNGTKSTHGMHFFKMSCMCEKVAIGSGVRERMMEHTNIPINLFDEMFEKLNTYNRYIIMNDKNVNDTSHKIFISAEKINYVQLIAIYDIDNNMLGFISAEMSTSYSKESADEEKKVLDGLSKQLTPVLSFSEYFNDPSVTM